MVRDTTSEKTDYSLVLDGPMFERWAKHLTAGARKYDKRNWMKAQGQEELDRFRESAVRHFIMWYQGLTDEDHAAAVLFNVNGAEYVRGRSPYEVRSAGLSDMPLLQVETPEAPESPDMDAVSEVRQPPPDNHPGEVWVSVPRYAGSAKAAGAALMNPDGAF